MNLYILFSAAGLSVILLVTAILVLLARKGYGPTRSRREAPADGKRNNLKWVVGTVIVVGLLTWGLTSSHEQENKAETVARSSGIPVVQPKEEWVFLWHLPPGQYDRGRNEETLEVRIVKNDPDALWFETPYENMGTMEVSRFQTSKKGDQFIGTWSQDRPNDGGSIYLNKVGEQMWVGQLTDKSGLSCACTLKRK